MSQHSVANAKNHLADLINRSLAGESVVITRHGHPVVELKPVQTAGHRITRETLAWVRAQRVECSSTVDAGTLVSQIRDEYRGDRLPLLERARRMAGETPF